VKKKVVKIFPADPQTGFARAGMCDIYRNDLSRCHLAA
jgi:uncharacterized protein (DUF2237 family)